MWIAVHATGSGGEDSSRSARTRPPRKAQGLAIRPHAYAGAQTDRWHRVRHRATGVPGRAAHERAARLPGHTRDGDESMTRLRPRTRGLHHGYSETRGIWNRGRLRFADGRFNPFGADYGPELLPQGRVGRNLQAPRVIWGRNDHRRPERHAIATARCCEWILVSPPIQTVLGAATTTGRFADLREYSTLRSYHSRTTSERNPSLVRLRSPKFEYGRCRSAYAGSSLLRRANPQRRFPSP